MFKNIIKTALSMSVAFLLSMVATLILGNVFSASEFGEFAMMRNFILVGSTFAIMGMDQHTIRKNVGGRPIIDYFTINMISIVLSGFFSLSMKGLYGLDNIQVIFLWGIIFAGSNILYLSSIYRLKNKFILAQFIHNGWKVILFLSVMGLYFMSEIITIRQLYIILSVTLVSIVLFHYFISPNILAINGDAYDKANQRKIIRESMLLWLINVLGLIFSGMERFIIPTIADTSILGSYYAVAFIYLTGFTMLGSAVGYVLFPYLTQNKNIKWPLFYKLIICGMILLVAVLYLFGEFITNLAFSGKYDHMLIPTVTVPIIGLGVVQCLHTIIHFYIYARANKIDLQQYILFMFYFCAFYFISFIIMDYYVVYSIPMMALHIFIIWCLKILYSGIILIRINSRSSALAT